VPPEAAPRKPITGVADGCAHGDRPRDRRTAYQLDEFPPSHLPPNKGNVSCSILKA